MVNKTTSKTATDAPTKTLVGPERPVPIALVDLGGQLPFKLAQLVAKLNRIQSVFAFRVLDHVVGHAEMGKYDLPHNHSDEHLFTLIRKRTNDAGYQYGIGVTHECLEKSRFNSHDQSSFDVGVITIDSAEKYVPLGRTLSKYVAYLLVCEAFCLVGKTHFEHPESYACVFDECHQKDDLRKCLRKPDIEDDCKENLVNAGFAAKDVAGAMSILKFVRRPSFLHVIRQSAESPFSGFFIGGLLVHVFGTQIAHFEGVYGTVVYFALGFGLGVSLLYNYRWKPPND